MWRTRWDISFLGVTDAKKISVQYYPNPVKDVLTISSDKNVSQISVYSVTGQLMEQNHHFNSINLGKFSSGIYFVRTTIEGQNKMIKAIKK
ncbi:T9SS type A sorting domain-containing protein [Epilithonimonas tenax]|uniref:T9SS type A sorting domain-containing protein n=1 Tax=Epilithonimonas tenax TaxID=191577 RepID=UPI0003FD23DE|nr:T9SS type A sorting domain-containing protein [Epilithonimonas tenax]